MVLISLRFRKVLRRTKLTHFHISVKRKGSLRGYFIFEIADLRLDIGLKLIILPPVYSVRAGLGNPMSGTEVIFLARIGELAGPEPNWYRAAMRSLRSEI